MWIQSRKIFRGSVLVLFGAMAFAGGHHDLNGTWVLEPTRSDFAGQSVIQTGAVTINDRQHNIYISRNFTYDGENRSFEYSFSTDGRENSTIHQGKTFKSKAKWDGDVLKVKTTQNDVTTVEAYSLAPDGALILVVDRPGHRALTLFFHR
jgi:hypothetical protein